MSKTMKDIHDIFKPAPLGSIELRNDRRVKVGSFVPDKKTGRFYRIHPDTLIILNTHISNIKLTPKMSSYAPDLYNSYIQKQLNPPIIIRSEGIA